MGWFRIYYSGSQLIEAKDKESALAKFEKDDCEETDKSITNVVEEDDTEPTNIPLISVDDTTNEDRINSRQEEEIRELAENDPDFAEELANAQYDDERFIREQAALYL